MRVTSVRVRDFRSYGDAIATIGSGLTVVSGPNGAGKTNLLEALYLGCTGRSCRTSNEREVIRFGAGLTRVSVEASAEDGSHELSVALATGQPKRMLVDGTPVEGFLGLPARPLVSVFLPDRLELVKGAPALRRAHLDQFIAAMWPARVGTRRTYAQALAQRNALIARIRHGSPRRSTLATWDAQVARAGIELMTDRRAAVDAIAVRFAPIAAALGLDGEIRVVYRPRSRAADANQLTAELAERIDSDLERGFTSHGPHRDDLSLSRDGRELRTYGSQGQQRLALLVLLLAERESLASTRPATPLMLLDDVMSELDGERRRALVELLRSGEGQSVITTTDLEHVPGASDTTVTKLAVSSGRILQEAIAA